MSAGAAPWERLRNGEPVPFRALGRSMLPAYPPGSLFLIRPCSMLLAPGRAGFPRPALEAPRLGDLLLMVHEDQVRLHRWVGWRDGLLLTKGDWCENPDAPWPATTVLGRAVAVERNGRWVPVPRGRRRTLWLNRASGPVLGGVRRWRQSGRLPRVEQAARRLVARLINVAAIRVDEST